MFFGISLIPLAVLIIVGQLKKAPRTSPNDPGYREQKEQARKHLRILDVPRQLYDLWQKFNVSRGVLFACAIALIIIEFGLAFLP